MHPHFPSAALLALKTVEPNSLTRDRAAVEEQGAATAEIARNIQQAAAGTQKVTHNIDGASSVANQSGETAAHVLESSGSLAAESEALSNEVARFLNRIKAA